MAQKGANETNHAQRVDYTSLTTGVHYHKKRGVWIGYININKKRYESPYFRGPDDRNDESFKQAEAWRKERAAAAGNTNGQRPARG